MTEVIKIFGGPGTGKTTTLVGNTDIPDYKGVLHRMFEEKHPSEVMLIAYTSSARDEAKSRLAKLTEYTESRLDDRITTIHSLTMGLNNIYPDKICELRRFRGKNDYKSFCKQAGLYYDSNSSDDDIMSTPDDDGHQFFEIYGWLQSNMMEYDEWAECPASTEWTHGDEFVDFASDWDRYKSKNGVYEFNDAIEESVKRGHTVDASHLFVDETQDLYPLQQAFLDNQFGAVDRIWFAADDDQTIYEWSGANPEYVIDMEAEVDELQDEYWDDKAGYWDSEGVYILNKSWRMPTQVLELSQMCIEQVEHRQDKNFEPHHDDGEISVYRYPNADQIISEINHDDTFVLFRANYLANEFGRDLIDRGIPYVDRFKTWREEVVDLRDGLAALKNEEAEMSGSSAARIIENLPNHDLKQPSKRSSLVQIYSGKDTVDCSAVADQTHFKLPSRRTEFTRWLVEFEELNWYQMNAVHENLKRDKEHLYPEGLTLETIHWSKGREADTVIVPLDSTQTVMSQCLDGITDAERRLYYVAITRTKRKLVLAEHMTQGRNGFEMDEIFTPEWRDTYQYE